MTETRAFVSILSVATRLHVEETMLREPDRRVNAGKQIVFQADCNQMQR